MRKTHFAYFVMTIALPVIVWFWPPKQFLIELIDTTRCTLPQVIVLVYAIIYFIGVIQPSEGRLPSSD